MKHLFFAIIMMISFVPFLKGQLDPHFSQYHHTPLLVNPAKAGQIDGDVRFIGNYRNQWSSVTVPFSTIVASYDMRIPKYFGKSCSYFGAGFVFLNDQAGDANFKRTMANIALTYNQSLSKRGKPTYMTVGLMIGGGQHGFDADKLYFDSQFNGNDFDTNINNGESINNTSLLYLDISAGINFAIALGKKSGISVGLGMFHLNRPNVSFMNDAEVNLYRRFVFNLDGRIRFDEVSKFSFLPTFIYMNQGPDEVFTLGGLLRYSTSDEMAISLGAVYRTSDAFVPLFRIDFQSVAFALSYDINTSQLSRVSNTNGGVELSLILTPNVFSEKQECGAIFCPF